MFLDADHREAGDVVPDSFPGTLVIEPNKNKDPFLHANYREHGQNDNKEFKYFIKNCWQKETQVERASKETQPEEK